MTIDKKFADGKLMMKVAGRLDTNTCPELDEQLKLDGVTEVVFDFSELEYISSAGLRVLMSVQKAMMAVGGEVAVASASEMVHSTLDMTGLSSVFKMI